MAVDFAGFVTITKVKVPRHRDNLLARPQLLTRFQNLLDYKLINITAPAGFGKTSLLIEVAHQLDLPVCWYAIDPLDNDPQRFISHFLAAILQEFPIFEDAVNSILSGNTSTLNYLITPIVNAVYEHIHEYFIFVLDDFHLITNKEVISFVDQFIQFVDESCHLVLLSRKLVRLPSLILMVGRLEVGGMTIRELAFKPAEIKALALQNYGISLSDEAAGDLAQTTEGWITGLILSTQSFWKNVTDQMNRAQSLGIDVYDYLAQQVHEQQPPSVQDFLLRTALLEEFDADLCHEVFGPATYPDNHTWQTLMQFVVQNNAFALPLDNRGTWLRYHHLFQDFLQTKIKRERPAEARQILQKLAELFAGRGEWEKAYALYQNLEDSPATINLVEQVGIRMVEAGRLKTLGAWIDAFPPVELTTHPLLAALRGYVFAMLGEVKQGRLWLSQAETAFRTTNDNNGLAHTLVWRSGVHRLLGNYEASLADAEEGLCFTDSDETPSLLKAMALRARGQSLLATRKSDESLKSLENSLEIYKALGESEDEARLFLELGVAYMITGYYQKALRYYDLALNHYRTTGNAIRMADLLNNKGVLYHSTGEYQPAISALEQALTYAQQSNYARLEAYILCGVGDIYTDLEALDAAEKAYRQAHQIATQIDDNFLLFYLELAEAALARLQEDLEQARAILGYAGQLVQQSNSSYEKGLYYLEAGQIANIEQRYPEAIDNLNQAILHFSDNGEQIEKGRAYLHLAAAHHALDENRYAATHLESSFALFAPLESRHPLVVTAQHTPQLLKAAQQWKGVEQRAIKLQKEVEDFRFSIGHVRRSVRKQMPAIPFPSPRLIIQTLGPVTVFLNDKAVDAPEWKKQKQVREFFFYLLAHPEGQTREAIGLNFWPNSSPSDVKVQFKNTIYRLRRALDKDFIIYDPDVDHYYFNHNLDYEYDVEQFEYHLETAQKAKNVQKQIKACTAAIELYKGAYLPETEGTWAIPKRQRLSHLYVQANLKLAQLYLNKGEHNLVLAYCWNILNEDLCQEIAHRLMMQAYAAMGDRAAVVRQFEWCKKVIREEVNAPVSPQTRDLYQTLIR